MADPNDKVIYGVFDPSRLEMIEFSSLASARIYAANSPLSSAIFFQLPWGEGWSLISEVEEEWNKGARFLLRPVPGMDSYDCLDLAMILEIT